MKCIHLLSQSETPREYRSIQEVRQVTELAGYEYIQMVNEPMTMDTVGKDFCTPRQCNDRPFKLTPAHYGCFTSHKNAIQTHLTNEGLWIFECDAVFTVDHDEAVRRMKRAVEVCNNHNEILAFTLGYRHNGQGVIRVCEDVITVNQWIETHSFFIPGSSEPVFKALFANEPWDAVDYFYLINLMDRMGHTVGIFADRPICVQGIGVSIIDGKLKGSEPHFRNVRYHASFGWKA